MSFPFHSLLRTVCFVAAALTPVVCARGATPTTFHVTPGGNDATAAGPFATPARVLSAVRALRQAGAGKFSGPVTVELHAGTYRLTEPLVFGPDDSGTAESPVVWSAHPGETVVLSGGVSLADWQTAELAGHKVWVTKFSSKVAFHSLWVNDEARPRARHPNAGFLTIREPPVKDGPWEVGSSQFQYTPGDVPAFAVDDAEVFTFSRWVESRLPVLRNDAANHEFRFSRRTVFKIEAGDLYRVENAAEFLDEPGEWYFRQKTGEIFYLPKPGETIANFRAIVPQLSQLVRFDGKPEASRVVENITFRGLTFAHAEWPMPPAPIEPDGKLPRGGFEQAAVGVGGAVSARGAKNCSFEDCRFAHLNAYAIELAKGCRDNRVERCTFTDLGAGGIKIGETKGPGSDAEAVRANRVIDCDIGSYGRLFQSAVGVLILESADNVIAHNEIHDGFYSGISVGWTWGYDPTAAHGNVIEHNHIHHIGKLSTGEGPLLSDMGTIYTLGTQPGTVIRFNRLHDIAGRVYGAWGIYFDEGSSQILAEKNLVYNTMHGAMHHHYGRENVVRNNIFAFGQTRQIERSQAEGHKSFTFERNIVVWNQGEGIVGAWATYNASFAHNQYWPFGKAQATFAYQSFEQWQKRGMDADSVVADPGFIDAEEADFRFKSGGGPAKSVGFETWDLQDVGPRVRLTRD